MGYGRRVWAMGCVVLVCMSVVLAFWYLASSNPKGVASTQPKAASFEEVQTTALSWAMPIAQYGFMKRGLLPDVGGLIRFDVTGVSQDPRLPDGVSREAFLSMSSADQEDLINRKTPFRYYGKGVDPNGKDADQIVVMASHDFIPVVFYNSREEARHTIFADGHYKQIKRDKWDAVWSKSESLRHLPATQDSASGPKK